jgi:hypothetical protein
MDDNGRMLIGADTDPVFDAQELRPVRELLGGVPQDPRRFVIEVPGQLATLRLEVTSDAAERGQEFIDRGRIGFRALPAEILQQQTIPSEYGDVLITLIRAGGRRPQLVLEVPNELDPTHSRSTGEATLQGLAGSRGLRALVGRATGAVEGVVGRSRWVLAGRPAEQIRKFSVDWLRHGDDPVLVEWIVDPWVSSGKSDVWQTTSPPMKIDVTLPAGAVVKVTDTAGIDNAKEVNETSGLTPIGSGERKVAFKSVRRRSDKRITYDKRSGMYHP